MVPSAPITIVTMEIFKFHNFWSSRFRSWLFLIFLCWEIPNQWYAGTAESTIWAFLLVLFTIIMSGLPCSVILSVWLLKSVRILKDSLFVQAKGLRSNHFLGTLKSFFLQIFQCTLFPIQPCRRLYSIWRSLRHSEIMWLFHRWLYTSGIWGHF